jgi:transcriptional regulator with XRE-family HTH domain
MSELSFGRRLKALREGAGLSQPELAKLAGVPQSSIASWELDKFDPGWSKVVKLCCALGVSCEAFTADTPAAKGRRGRRGSLPSS